MVSIAAMGCQKTMAAQIGKAEADYLLALKDNHPVLSEDVRRWLATEVAPGRLCPEETVEKDHGRLESRRDVVSDAIEWLPQQPEWVGLQAMGRVESSRRVGDKTTTECRYSLCSCIDRARFAEAVPSHWDIETGQHWVLDVQFGEDANRTRQNYSAENLALIRRMALNGRRHNGPLKDSLRLRQLRALLNDDYRAQLSFGPQQT